MMKPAMTTTTMQITTTMMITIMVKSTRSRTLLLAGLLPFCLSMTPALAQAEAPSQAESASGAADIYDEPEGESVDDSETETEPDIQDPVTAPVPTQNNVASFLQAPFRQQQFVPDISLILDMGVGGYSIEDAQRQSFISPYNLQQQVDSHHMINPNTGFNLNYAELSLSAPVDPYLDLFTVFHLSAFEIEIEEAYGRTRGLPFNTEIKAGKFLSHFGRLNAQHAHFWNFNDNPLVYQHFFGSENLNELGLRLGWLAPTDFYLDFGLEFLQGQNPVSFGQQGFVSGDRELKAVNWPNLVVGTAKASVDLSDNLVLLGGLSYARGGQRVVNNGAVAEDAHAGHFHAQQLAEGTPVQNYVGVSQVFGADASLRWFINSYQELSWQSELLFKDSSGNQYVEGQPVARQLLQLGGYSELAWRFAQQWRTGLRADIMGLNQDVNQGSNGAALQDLQPSAAQTRYTALLEYYPSEFTRLRMQYNLDATGFDLQSQAPVHGLFLNLNLVMGAHGAHVF
jgi:hypothetical protein